MQVILLQDIDNLGKKYEVKNVADGYARNFLLARGLAKIASQEAIKCLKEQKEIENKKAEEALKKVQEAANKIEGVEVVIPVKVGEKGELFEAVNAQKISEKLKEMNFDIKKSQINLAEPIKELGEFPLRVSFDHNLEVQITLVISPQYEQS